MHVTITQTIQKQRASKKEQGQTDFYFFNKKICTYIKQRLKVKIELYNALQCIKSMNMGTFICVLNTDFTHHVY